MIIVCGIREERGGGRSWMKGVGVGGEVGTNGEERIWVFG